jgi:sterol desaturase/sphingolipid hydroxylase (fatty acid hydroxylase superfamily)
VSPIILYAIPFFVLSLLLESILVRGHRVVGYEWRDTLASLAMGIGSLLAAAPLEATVFATNTVLYEHRLFDLGDAWWVWPALIVCEDFCYYWFHRLHHELRLLWAGHVNHHSSEHYNLSTALRQPWTTVLTGPVFWVPLPLLGFSPTMILTAQAISLLYQYWIHTELIDRLGPYEWVFNTPSHHRVHHGANPRYLDRNHGGILIVWDRLFGTFQREDEDEPVRYGLTTNIHTFNPLRIAFHEWVAMGRDLLVAPRYALGYLVGPPGWSHDGSRQTSRQLRRGEFSGKTKVSGA